MQKVINDGKIVWCGENPGIYLKDSLNPTSDWVSLALYFRVVISRYGRGRGILLLGAPNSRLGYPKAPNLCIADNLPLMQYLLREFVPHYGSFKNTVALSSVPLLAATGGKSDTNNSSSWLETISDRDTTLTLKWSGFHEPFSVDADSSMTSTGRHQMYSTFQGATSGEIFLNGDPLPGVPINRPFFNGHLSSAFLAFAETWLEPSGERNE